MSVDMFLKISSSLRGAAVYWSGTEATGGAVAVNHFAAVKAREYSR